jgi:hypothetical protein
LEASNPASGATDIDQSYAKQKLGVKRQQTKLLGVSWNKATDKIRVTFPDTSKDAATKRTVLSEFVPLF